MGSRKKIRRVMAAGAKANSSPPKDYLPDEWYEDAWDDHCSCGCGAHTGCFLYTDEEAHTDG